MNDATLLYRQVNPAFLQNGKITSQVFTPTPKDNKSLSVYDGDRIQPEDSWFHYCKKTGLCSIGVSAVCVSECISMELLAHPSPIPDNPDHASIDFPNDTSNGKIKYIAKTLKDYAIQRGWQYFHKP